MTTRVRVLGCGSSGGVPRVGGLWGNCDPDNPRNVRRRCGILVERTGKEGVTRILVDTPPDLRMQLLDAGVGVVDAVLYTHEHADHTHGIDDLRQVAFNSEKRVDVFMSERVWNHIVPKFSYCFEAPPGGLYPPILNACELNAFQPLTISGKGGDIEVLPMNQQHGSIRSLGFRFGDFAYSTDVNDFPAATIEKLQGTKIWIVDALRYQTHRTHFNVEAALAWIERIGPDRAYLTNMHHDLDYETLLRSLPPHVEPAYDGLSFEINA